VTGWEQTSIDPTSHRPPPIVAIVLAHVAILGRLVPAVAFDLDLEGICGHCSTTEHFDHVTAGVGHGGEEQVRLHLKGRWGLTGLYGVEKTTTDNGGSNNTSGSSSQPLSIIPFRFPDRSEAGRVCTTTQGKNYHSPLLHSQSPVEPPLRREIEYE